MKIAVQLDGSALLQRNTPKVLAVLHEGIQSKEHQAFVEQLAQARANA